MGVAMDFSITANPGIVVNNGLIVDYSLSVNPGLTVMRKIAFAFNKAAQIADFNSALGDIYQGLNPIQVTAVDDSL